MQLDLLRVHLVNRSVTTWEFSLSARRDGPNGSYGETEWRTGCVGCFGTVTTTNSEANHRADWALCSFPFFHPPICQVSDSNFK